MSRLEEAEQRLRQLEREIFQLRRFGRDRFVVGDVIRFTKDYGDDTGSYMFAAIKIDDNRWYTTRCATRSSCKPITYINLIEFIVQHPLAVNVQVATNWIDVADAADEWSGVRAELNSFVSPSFTMKDDPNDDLNDDH